jgi:hypothetical protein
MTASSVNPAYSRPDWEPMRLDYLGQVGELMRATTTGSKRDDPQKGCGSDRRRSGTGDPC